MPIPTPSILPALLNLPVLLSPHFSTLFRDPILSRLGSLKWGERGAIDERERKKREEVSDSDSEGGGVRWYVYGRDLESLDETANFKVIVIINIKLNVKPF